MFKMPVKISLSTSGYLFPRPHSGSWFRFPNNAHPGKLKGLGFLFPLWKIQIASSQRIPSLFYCPASEIGNIWIANHWVGVVSLPLSLFLNWRIKNIKIKKEIALQYTTTYLFKIILKAQILQHPFYQSKARILSIDEY